MRYLLISATALMCLTVHATETKLAYVGDLEADYSIVSVDGAGANRTVVVKEARRYFTTYVKRQFDCVNSKVRYLGSSNDPNGFQSQQEDQYFSSADITYLSKLIWTEACKDFFDPLTVSQ